VVELQTIDKVAYDYFRTLTMLVGVGGPPSDAPANPLSGFSNGALGYFYAHGSRRASIVVP
jgi:hypothetical protein